MFGETGGRLFGATLLGAVAITASAVGAVHYFAANASAPLTAQAAKPAPVKQSIAGLKSVLDPMTTGSVSRTGAPVVLDPCTGARKN